MVESYFDKAGKHTSIRADKLNFYKKPDNVVKFTLTLVRGIHNLNQTTAQLKWYQLTDVNIRLINYQPKEELGMLNTLIFKKFKL